jgi:hypothetical protein
VGLRTRKIPHQKAGQLVKKVEEPCHHLERLQLYVSGLVGMTLHLPWLLWPFVHFVWLINQ